MRCFRMVPTLACATIAAAVAFAFGPVQAQDADRERAQMLQMQQQLRRVQSDNSALQQERNQLQEKAKDADRLKAEAATTGKEVAKLRGQTASDARELAAVRAQLDALREQMGTQIGQWKKAVDERDTALQFAAVEKHKADAASALLAARLKAQTERGDICEVRHTQALKLGNEVIDRYEKDRLRLCDPVTGFWRVRAEGEIQDLRQRLYDLRLDLPPPPAATAAPASGTAEKPADKVQ